MAVVVSALFTVMLATLELVVVESLSTLAATRLMPACVALKVAVAVPAAWMVVCSPEMLPVLLQATGRPINRSIFPATEPPAEFVNTEAVMAAVWLTNSVLGTAVVKTRK